MMSYSYIRQLSREAGERASRVNRKPMVLTGLGDDALAERLRHIPNLGDYEPKGWKMVDSFMVDSSGLGRPGEPALTFAEFCEYVQRHPGKGFAIIEEGQFQVVVGEFEKQR